MLQGTIKRLHERGFGFIEHRNDKGARTEFFFHRSALTDGTRFEQLRQGQTVNFEIGEQGPKGPRAAIVARA